MTLQDKLNAAFGGYGVREIIIGSGDRLAMLVFTDGSELWIFEGGHIEAYDDVGDLMFMRVSENGGGKVDVD